MVGVGDVGAGALDAAVDEAGEIGGFDERGAEEEVGGKDETGEESGNASAGAHGANANVAMRDEGEGGGSAWPPSIKSRKTNKTNYYI